MFIIRAPLIGKDPEYIGMSVSYLQKDRMNGHLSGHTPGPRYAKLGKRVVYLLEDLDAWLQAHLVNRAS